jgi:hypothetical protein
MGIAVLWNGPVSEPTSRVFTVQLSNCAAKMESRVKFTPSPRKSSLVGFGAIVRVGDGVKIILFNSITVALNILGQCQLGFSDRTSDKHS